MLLSISFTYSSVKVTSLFIKNKYFTLEMLSQIFVAVQSISCTIPTCPADFVTTQKTHQALHRKIESFKRYTREKCEIDG